LSVGLNRTRSNRTDLLRRDFRVDANLHEQACGDHARASTATATMNENVLAFIQSAPKTDADLWPFCFEFWSRCADVGDGHVDPFHSSMLNLGTEAGDREPPQFVGLKQRDDDLRAPGRNCVKVRVEVSRPGAAEPSVVLARGEVTPILPLPGPRSTSAIRIGSVSLVLIMVI
jgi:hypothetical protein